jgi:hypothetical protein
MFVGLKSKFNITWYLLQYNKKLKFEAVDLESRIYYYRSPYTNYL